MRHTSLILAFIVLLLSVLVVLSYLPRFFSLLPGIGTEEPSGGASSSALSSIGNGSASSPGSTDTPSPASQSAVRESSCVDDIDNDGDQLADCDDPDCVGSASCRCSALSCGGSGPQCSPAEGCICDATAGCVSCRNEGDSCGSDADCCGGMGLSCTEILRNGTRESRCLRTQARLCTVRCIAAEGEAQGTWERPRNCGVDFVPPGAGNCAELTGVCTISPRPERNTVRCWES